MIDFVTLIAGRLVRSVGIEFTRYMIAAAGLTLLYWLLRRVIAHRRIQNRAPTMADRRREFINSVQTICVFAVVNLLAFGMIRMGLIQINRGPADPFVLLAQVSAMIVLHDAWFYWMHRSLHHKLLFRMAHATHHDLHHTEGRYNFGLYFTWWDRMMGTEHPTYHARFEEAVARQPEALAANA